MRDDAGRAPRNDGHGAARRFDLADVVPVDLASPPAERFPFRDQWFEVQHLSHGSQTLDLVVIDDGDKIVQSVVRSEQGGLPHTALVAFAVTEQNEDAVRPAIAPHGKRHPTSDRESVTECTRGRLDAGDSHMRDVAGQSRAVPTEIIEPCRREESALREDGVEAGRSMALAQDEAVAAGPRRLSGPDAE